MWQNESRPVLLHRPEYLMIIAALHSGLKANQESWLCARWRLTLAKMAAITYVISCTCAAPAGSSPLDREGRCPRTWRWKCDGHGALHALQNINEQRTTWFHQSITINTHIRLRFLRRNWRLTGSSKVAHALRLSPNKLQIRQIRPDKSLGNLARSSNKDVEGGGKKGPSTVQVQSRRLIFHRVAPRDTLVHCSNSGLSALMTDEWWFIPAAVLCEMNHTCRSGLMKLSIMPMILRAAIYTKEDTHSEPNRERGSFLMM